MCITYQDDILVSLQNTVFLLAIALIKIKEIGTNSYKISTLYSQRPGQCYWQIVGRPSWQQMGSSELIPLYSHFWSSQILKNIAGCRVTTMKKITTYIFTLLLTQRKSKMI